MDTTGTTFRFFDYETGSEVGTGDLRLARESVDAGEEGVVSASMGPDGIFHFVPPGHAETWEKMGRTVISVYLDPCVSAAEVWR